LITSRIGFVLLGLVLIGVTLIYAPGLNGPFVLDDEENITAVREIAIHHLDYVSLRDAAFSNDSGPFKRPLPALSFALNHYLAGGFESTFGFKLTNLLIHLANTVLVFFFCRALLDTPALLNRIPAEWRVPVAVLAAALWACHPIQVTNVLYVVQRMNSLSALFVLTGLILFVHGRTQLNTIGAKGFTLMIFGTIGGTALGLASKENAALLPLFALVIEYSLFRFRTHDERTRRLLLIFYMLVVVLPAVSLVTYLVLNPDFILNSYVTRHFSLLERVLTETRVLWYYIGLILFPAGHRFGLFHDDITLSTGLFTPVSTLFSVIGLLAVLGLGLIQAKRHPLISFAILWFLAGHAIESDFLGLELAYEHRNYLPSYGLLFAATFGLVSVTRGSRLAGTLTLAAVILTLSFFTWNRANAWSDLQGLAEQTVRTHPDSPRANDFAARTSLSVKHDMGAAIRYTLNGLRLAPDEVGFHVDLQVLLGILGNEVEHRMHRSPTRNIGRRFDVRVTGLDENLPAIETKDGIRLSHHGSSPELISRLLRNIPISTHGIFSLENLRHCLLDPPRPCTPLRGMASAWFTMAMENPATSRDYRGILAGDAAMLYADNGDTERALEYIDFALSYLPEHISYRLAKAEYLIRLGRLDEALRDIDHIISDPPPTDMLRSAYESRIRALREAYDKAAKHRHATRSPTR
jgi:tetratricopeptide (TPR) repeat protein